MSTELLSLAIAMFAGLMMTRLFKIMHLNFPDVTAFLIAGVLAYKVAHVNYLQMCGMMAGSMTDPPALAFANGLYKSSEASALSYATVYPFTMFLRILSPQIMIICMVALGG